MAAVWTELARSWGAHYVAAGWECPPPGGLRQPLERAHRPANPSADKSDRGLPALPRNMVDVPNEAVFMQGTVVTLPLRAAAKSEKKSTAIVGGKANGFGVVTTRPPGSVV